MALADPKLKARFADLGGTVLAGSPADFGKLIADETEKWAKVVKFSGASRSDPKLSSPYFITFRYANDAGSMLNGVTIWSPQSNQDVCFRRLRTSG